MLIQPAFQSPRGDFGFLKGMQAIRTGTGRITHRFNPLAGILVF